MYRISAHFQFHAISLFQCVVGFNLAKTSGNGMHALGNDYSDLFYSLWPCHIMDSAFNKRHKALAASAAVCTRVIK